MSFNKDVFTGSGSSTSNVPLIPFPMLILWNMITVTPAVPSNLQVPACTKESQMGPILPKLPNAFH